MANIKIILEDGETELDAHVALEKAINFHNSGEVHLTESFDDPAMIDLSQKMEDIHKNIYTDMIREINDELDKEYE